MFEKVTWRMCHSWGSRPQFIYLQRLSWGRMLAPKKDACCTEEDVLYCFRLLLGREPPLDEWQWHKGEIGKNLDVVVSTYLSSLEFKNRNLINPPIKPELVDLHDFKIYVNPNDLCIGRVISTTKTYESHVTQIMKKFLKRGMTFLDVGANVGYYSLLAASIIGPSGKIIAVEPGQLNVKLLYLRSIINKFNNIDIYPFAASDRRGLVSYADCLNNGTICYQSDPRQLLNLDLVYSEKLDNLVDRVDIIKIDVEGADYLALRGANRLLETHPIIFAEFGPPALQLVSGISGEKYLELLIDAKYNISVIALDGTIIDCEKDITKIMKNYRDAKTDHIDIFAS